MVTYRAEKIKENKSRPLLDSTTPTFFHPTPSFYRRISPHNLYCHSSFANEDALSQLLWKFSQAMLLCTESNLIYISPYLTYTYTFTK